MLVALTAACLYAAAAAYQIPIEVLEAVRRVEAGRVGASSKNTNGTSDLGPFQINEIWLPTFTRYWGLASDLETRERLLNDGCANAAAAAAILRYHWLETRHLGRAVGRYHSRTPARASDYLGRVIAKLPPGS